MKKIKLLIDTDIGDDIDDAFALLLAMKMQVEIIGITTVFKNTVERARIAKKILKLYSDGYDTVPVLAGFSSLLQDAPEAKEHLCQYSSDIEDNAYTPDETNSEKAIDFIIDSCKKYGKDLTILAIGPFTNIANAIKKDRDALDQCGNIVIMGGAYYKQYSDWNVICDVESAKYMFDNLENIKCIGADVTHKVRISEANDEMILNSSDNPMLEYISQLYLAWKNSSNGALAVLHDPLAVYYAIDPSICTTEEAEIAVCAEGYARGLTLNVNAYGKKSYNDAYLNNRLNKDHMS